MYKIIIVTVFGSYNHGSFLQAKMLGKYLAKYGKITYLDAHTRNWNVLYTALRRANFFRRQTKNPIRILSVILYEIIEAFKLKKAWKSLEITEVFNSNEIIILGSDEIWNISRQECRYPVFWGDGLKGRKISYAPSIHNANDKDFENYLDYTELLKNISEISVRDMKSKMILEKYTDKKISVVLDPTFLNRAETYKIQLKKPYIAVYSFEGHISKGDQEKIIHFARERNFELIATGQTIMWCDRCVHSKCGNPFYIFEEAEFVITSTFHGTAYAINYNTKFVAFVKGNDKVENLLMEFELEDRIPESGDDIQKIWEKDIDYIRVNELLEEKRRVSRTYIEKAIIE